MIILQATILSAKSTRFDLVLAATVVAAILWLAAEAFLYWRRRATNLTPVVSARANEGAQPEFLTIDRAAREAALRRADAFERRLATRERQTARAARQSPPGRSSRIASAVSLFMSVFSLVTLIAGAIWQVRWVGAVMDDYTTWDRIGAVLRAHPIAFAVSALVVTYHVIQFFVARKWRRDRPASARIGVAS